MWIFIVIIGVVAILAFYGSRMEKKGKEEANSKLKGLDGSRNVTVSFISQAGYLAFCDYEKTLISYRNFDKRLVEIKYDTILHCEKHSQINGVAFWALTPTYTEYGSGDVGADKLVELQDKFSSIITQNSTKAYSEYKNIVAIPSNAARVHIKGCKGYSSLISNSIQNISDVHFWADDNSVFMMPSFSNLVHFRTCSNVYRVITINKSNIVSVVQEGDVHYTTEVHGGGGGSSSIKGAIIGGVIAGEAGAIIGSRKSIDPITSSTKQIDDRTTNVKILDSNNNFCEILFEHNDYYGISKFVGK